MGKLTFFSAPSHQLPSLPPTMAAMKAMKAMKAAKVMKAMKAMKAPKAMKAMKAMKGKKSPWIAAVAAARKALNIKGFCAIKKGTPLYIKAKALYKKWVCTATTEGVYIAAIAT